MQCQSSCDISSLIFFFVLVTTGEKVMLQSYLLIYALLTRFTFLATDWYFNLHSPDGIYSTSRTEYHISLTKDALKNPTELRKSVKRILEVIVGLLKDRISASDEHTSKKCHIEAKIKKE